MVESVSFLHLTGADPAEVMIDRVVSDSREVTGGALFVALAGDKVDGHNFVDDVIAEGCAAVIIEKDRAVIGELQDTDICILEVDDSREVFAEVVAAFYGYPQKALKFIGITGTNGKTTITYLLEKVLEDNDHQVGVIGTVDYRFRDQNGIRHQLPAPLTTPDPLILQKQLRHMVDEGVDIVIMEVSSHALVQKRLGNIRFDIAAFTNLSHDHLDYHQSMEDYFQAKSLLFTDHLKKTGQVVLTFKDTDDAFENRWASALAILLSEQKIPYVSCGRQIDSVIQPLKIEVEIDRTEMSLLTPVGELSFVSPLVGRFNGDNIMTTLGIAVTMELDVNRGVESLQVATGAPGRLERVELARGEEQKIDIFVDYAHTPDALLNVLNTLKDLPHERLICIFGCGGDRDVTKRSEMGKIAAELSDVAIITDDNPRSESSSRILGHIVKGATSADIEQKSLDWLFDENHEIGCVVIPDRQDAIYNAIKSASADDIVLIAGKGHEKYQLTNQGKRYFDDCLEAREALFSWDVDSVSRALGVKPITGQAAKGFGSISTDSRKIAKDEIFVALQGDNFDGHDYLEQALSGGAGCLIITDLSKVSDEVALPVYKVADTLDALGNLAGYRRRMIAGISAPLIVGITGSCGKTTVKEMTTAIFEKRWPDGESAPLNRVLRTLGNFNNLIGLPLSLLPIQLKHRVAVLEMGMNQPGEIARLTEIADPDISCIVNVHGAHLEGLGTIEGVAKAKEELFAGTGKQSILIINLDDEHVASAAQKYPHKKISYTTKVKENTSADLWATDIRYRDDGKITFTLHISEKSKVVNLDVPGIHNVSNSLAAAAIAQAADTEVDIIVEGLESFQSADKRLEVHRFPSRYSIINDTYNANPASMKAGLATLASMNGYCKMAILGDMLELGEASEEAHREVGRIAAGMEINYIAVCGNDAKYIVDGALQAGMDKTMAHIFSNKDDICKMVEKMEREGELDNNSWILVKASRGMRFETIVATLAAE